MPGQDGCRVRCAPGKGNTLVELLRHSHGLCWTTRWIAVRTSKETFTPGTRIPIHDPEKILETRPDYVLILPWNLAKEITCGLPQLREWGGRFVVPIPIATVLP